MDYQIKTERLWRYRHPKRGRAELQPGLYRVPEDLPTIVAERAIDEGVALKIVAMPPTPATKARVQVGRRRRRAQGPAPENRALIGAPNDKQAVH